MLLIGALSWQGVGLQTEAYAQSHSHAAKSQAPVYRLGQVKSVSFEATTYALDMFPAPKPPQFEKQSQLAVKAVKPNLLRVDVLWSGNQTNRTPTGVEFLIRTGADPYISDGKTEFQMDKTLNVYRTAKAQPDLTRMSTDGLHQMELLFDKNPLRHYKFKFSRNAVLRGEPVALYSLKENNVRAGAGWYFLTELYLSKKTGMPTQISEWGQDNKHHWVEDEREEYSHWQIIPTFPASTFDTTPPPGVKPYSSLRRPPKQEGSKP
jgi:outer membrane lipoprotein-sorting protein